MKNNTPTYHEIESFKSTINEIISEKKTLEIQNSLLRYKNIKLIKEKQNLECKLVNTLHAEKTLKEKINYAIMNWEMIEELDFCDWVYHKENNISKISGSTKNKRKLSNRMSINKHQYDHEYENEYENEYEYEYENEYDHQYIKKQKKNKSDESDNVTILYDSDETETEDELLIIK